MVVVVVVVAAAAAAVVAVVAFVFVEGLYAPLVDYYPYWLVDSN